MESVNTMTSLLQGRDVVSATGETGQNQAAGGQSENLVNSKDDVEITSVLSTDTVASITSVALARERVAEIAAAHAENDQLRFQMAELVEERTRMQREQARMQAERDALEQKMVAERKATSEAADRKIETERQMREKAEQEAREAKSREEATRLAAAQTEATLLEQMRQQQAAAAAAVALTMAPPPPPPPHVNTLSVFQRLRQIGAI